MHSNCVKRTAGRSTYSQLVRVALLTTCLALMLGGCTGGSNPDEHATLVSCGDTQIARVRVENPGPRAATYEVVLAYFDDSGSQIATAAASDTVGEGQSTLIRPRLAAQYWHYWTDCDVIAVTRIPR